MKKQHKAFWISLFVGAVLSALVFFLGNNAGRGLVHRLCDAFFVAGVVVAGCGGLHFVSNQGMFDLMGYSIRLLFHIHWPWMAPRNKEEGKETYVDYKERKRAERKSPAGTLLAGAVYLTLAGMMLLIFYL